MKNHISLSIIALLAPFFTPQFAEGQWVVKNSQDKIRVVDHFAVKGEYLYAGASGLYETQGLFLSTNDGEVWTSVGDTNQQIFDIIINGTKLFIAASSGIFSVSDNGAVWDHLTLPLSRRLSILNDTTIFAITQNDGIYLSIDNGEIWQAINNGLTSFDITDLLVSDTILLAATRYQGVLMSTNLGTQWTPVNTGLTDKNINNLFKHQKNIFASTLDSGLFRSTNNGATWSPLGFGASSTWHGVTYRSSFDFFSIDNHILIISSASNLRTGVFTSNDNGTTWTSSKMPLFWYGNIGSIYLVDTIAYGAAFDTHGGGYQPGVMRSTDYGASWEVMSDGMEKWPAQPISTSTLIAKDGFLFAGSRDGGGGVWRRPLSEMIPTLVSPSMQLASFTLEPNHPNPFATSTSVSFTLAERGFVALDIYDLLGNKLRTLLRETLDAGEHSAEFDAKDLAAGVYVAKLRVNGAEREMKIIKSEP